MPVILDPAAVDAWLDPSVDAPEPLQRLLVPYPAEQMTAYCVSSLVNSPRHEAAECMAPAGPEQQQGTLF